MTDVRRAERSGRSLVWWAVAAVTACGLTTTAHGIWAVAVACGVDPLVALAYPVLADGLALAAYASTTKLQGRPWSQFYAWVVVVVAANLSGLAQGWHLASLGDKPGTTWALRFGMGYGVAVVCTVAAHLLWLVGRPRAATTKEDGHGEADQGREAGGAAGVQGSAEGARREHGQAGDGQVPGGEPTGAQRGEERPLVPAALATADAAGSGEHLPEFPDPAAPDLAGLPALAATNGNGHAVTLKAQAERLALDYLKENGVLPSENVLADLARCSRGTARNALAPLRKG